MHVTICTCNTICTYTYISRYCTVLCTCNTICTLHILVGIVQCYVHVVGTYLYSLVMYAYNHCFHCLYYSCIHSVCPVCMSLIWPWSCKIHFCMSPIIHVSTQYVQSVCLLSFMYQLSMSSLYVQSLCPVCMSSLYVQSVCL